MSLPRLVQAIAVHCPTRHDTPWRDASLITSCHCNPTPASRWLAATAFDFVFAAELLATASVHVPLVPSILVFWFGLGAVCFAEDPHSALGRDRHPQVARPAREQREAVAGRHYSALNRGQARLMLPLL
eukprot:CAMPEP_0114541516 /NCGR_PEP_ID=MMETSP0114-20121206/1346_1 /TAXON_ID=31324 /ORGANISM="Goniomonas sp, Strain m" /LENGTH=128 /DNA_ID=CAMNT_0001725757 /DNA_START=29 /DNA_END=411 /DNA_ORIENTATION=-